MNDITAVTPDHPVVVAGAGPVGLTTALLLASRGVPVRVAERARPEVAREWRGSTLHPPTLEILDRIGLADRAIARGVRVDRLAYGDLDSDDAAVFDYGVLDGLTRYPFRLQYEQYKLLDDLRAAAADSDAIEMCWEHEIVAVSTSATQADVTIDTPTGTVRWETPLLIAADGSHSAVRSALDIGMDGSTYPTLSLVVASEFDFGAVAGRPSTPVAYYTGGAGRLSLIRTPDIWRVAVSTDEPVDTDLSNVAPVDDARDAHPALVAALDAYVGDHSWAAAPLRQHQMYRSHQRVADRMVDGRVALIGDAAHLTSTTGGMGLNSGVHDAAHLVDALDVFGIDEALADYATVRRAVAMEVVQRATSRTRAEMDARSPDARAARLADLQAAAADPQRCGDHLRAAAMFDAVPGPRTSTEAS